jgi:hypothetical protein
VEQQAVEISHGEVMEYNQNIGLVLNRRIQASMKGLNYDVKVVFTQEDLVSCSCTGRAGSHGFERIV